MRYLMHTEPPFTATQHHSDHAAMAMSALQTTRDAIARWSGKALPAAAALPRDASRVSPQARWVACRNLSSSSRSSSQPWITTACWPTPCAIAP